MTNKRPLSPHITIHKWILSQIVSILHRATAIGFSIGLLFISLWLICFSFGQLYFSLFETIFFNFFGKLIILIIIFCFSFHFIDEFRKLFWVFGIGLNIKMIRISSYLVILISIIILILFAFYLA